MADPGGGGVRGLTPPQRLFCLFFCLSVYENPADLDPTPPSKNSSLESILLNLLELLFNVCRPIFLWEMGILVPMIIR